MSTKRQKLKKATSFSGFFKKLSDQLDSIQDDRASNSSYNLGDTLRSAFAMYSLKFSSLLAFQIPFWPLKVRPVIVSKSN